MEQIGVSPTGDVYVGRRHVAAAGDVFTFLPLAATVAGDYCTYVGLVETAGGEGIDAVLDLNGRRLPEPKPGEGVWPARGVLLRSVDAGGTYGLEVVGARHPE